MARTFTTGQTISVPSPRMPATSAGDVTMLVVHRRSSNGGGSAKKLLQATDSIASDFYFGLGMTGAADNLVVDINGNGVQASPNVTFLTTDEWACVAVTKAAGTVAPRFHKYVYGTGVSSHANGFSTAGNPDTFPTGKFLIGQAILANNGSVGDTALIAVFPSALSDEQFESAAQSLTALMALNPAYGLVILDGVVAVDLMSGATETVNTSTASTLSTPMAYGFPVPEQEATSSAVTGTAAFSGNGALTATGHPNFTGTAAFSGNGALTATGTPSNSGSATFSGNGALTATGVAHTSGAASFSGNGALTASGVVHTSGAASFSGNGALTGTGHAFVSGSANFSGNGALTASGVPVITGTAHFSANGTLTATGRRPPGRIVPSVPAVAVGGTLGCVEKYSILIASKEGIPLGELAVSEVEWSRVLDDFSEATVVIPLSGPECCGILNQIQVWHHELQLFRDGKYVWSGPIVNVTGDRTSVTLVARDLFALIQKRIIHNQICFALACAPTPPGAPADLAIIATALINDALAVDGHNYVIDATLCGRIGERLYQPGENAFGALQETFRLGLDGTCLGRKIVLGGANGGLPFGRSATLGCDDFLGNLAFEQDGLAAATRAITIGEGVIGVAVAPGADVNGEHPYYGLLEYVSPDRQELNTQPLADQAAAAIITSTFPPPTNLVTPTGSQLSPNAPITIDELVPGTITTVIVDCLCRDVQADLVLLKLEVTWTPDGEVVQVTYGSLGMINNGEE